MWQCQWLGAPAFVHHGPCAELTRGHALAPTHTHSLSRSLVHGMMRSREVRVQTPDSPATGSAPRRCPACSAPPLPPRGSHQPHLRVDAPPGCICCAPHGGVSGRCGNEVERPNSTRSRTRRGERRTGRSDAARTLRASPLCERKVETISVHYDCTVLPRMTCCCFCFEQDEIGLFFP